MIKIGVENILMYYLLIVHLLQIKWVSLLHMAIIDKDTCQDETFYKLCETNQPHGDCAHGHV